MKKLLCIAGILSALCFAATLPDIESLKQKHGAETIGVYYRGSDGQKYEQNADEILHAASTMKVPVMMEVFRQIQAGKLKLQQPIKVENKFFSIMDGSPYSLTPEEDSDADLYKEIGKELPLENLMERMINRSSNLATNLIIQLAKAENVQKFMKQIGAADMQVLRGVEDLKAYEAGKNNTTSARALGRCLEAIMDSSLFTETSRKEMMEILSSQHFRGGIPAGVERVEKGLRIANKDGWITGIRHDSAIIEHSNGKHSVLVVLTRGVKEDKAGEQLVADVAEAIWRNYKQ